MSKDISTIRKYNFNDGTTLYVLIELEKNRVSFLESPDLKNGKYEYKKWLFAERGAEYMNGWLNILHAMEHVIKEAKKELEEYQEQKNEDDTDFLINVMRARDAREPYYSHTNSKGVTYYLYKKDITLRGGKDQTIYYFKKSEYADDYDGEACQMPEGYQVKENIRNGFLTLSKV